MKTKRCSHCEKEKSFTEFCKNRTNKDGLSGWCKKCNHENSKQWRNKNLEKCREQHKQYQVNHPEKCREFAKRWRTNNRKKWNEMGRRWRIKNPEKCRERNKLWRLNNPRKWHAAERRASKKRRATPQGRLMDSISVSIRQALHGNKNGRQWEHLVGYTLETLKKHLEKRFQPKMTWQNYGKWHVDHIIPKSAFHYKAAEDPQFKHCWALSNLQPLWAKDNLKKHSKLILKGEYE